MIILVSINGDSFNKKKIFSSFQQAFKWIKCAPNKVNVKVEGEFIKPMDYLKTYVWEFGKIYSEESSLKKVFDWNNAIIRDI